MKKILFLTLWLSHWLCFGQYGSRDRYLVDSINLSELSTRDKSIIDSLTTIFHQTGSDSVKLLVLSKMDDVDDFNVYAKYKRYGLKFVNQFIFKNKKITFGNKFLYAMYGDALYGMSYVYSQLNNEDSALYYSKKSLIYFKKANNLKSIALAYDAMGTSYSRLGKIKESLAHYHKAQNIYEKIKSSKGIASCYLNIANVYRNIDEFEKAKTKFLQALHIYERENDVGNQAEIWNLLGITYKWSGDTINAEKAYTRSFELNKKINHIFGMASARLNLGIIFQNRKQYDRAIQNYEQSLTEFQKEGSQNGIAFTLNSLAVVYHLMNQPAKALPYAKQSYDLAIKMGYPESIMNACSELETIYKALGKYKEALEYKDMFIEMHDSIQGVEAQKTALESQLKYESNKKIFALKEKQIRKNLDHQRAQDQQFLIIVFVGVCFILVLIFSVYLYNRFRVIRKQKNIIEYQKHEVEEKNREILDSITYAKRLQEAILPPLKVVKEYLQNSFILYKPKDIVAGDFYFMETFEGKVVFAAADCTGHGVPGAMVSVVCSNALTRCVKEFKLTNPGLILDKTRELVMETFSKSESEVRDGMDVSLACIDFTNGELLWSGANNPIWIVYKSNPDELIEIKPDKQPIGNSDIHEPFRTHSTTLHVGDRLYIFTDGFADQFGGDSGKKLKAANFKKLIIEIQKYTMAQQLKEIDNMFESWRGSFEQLDDVCLIGVEYS